MYPRAQAWPSSSLSPQVRTFSNARSQFAPLGPQGTVPTPVLSAVSVAKLRTAHHGVCQTKTHLTLTSGDAFGIHRYPQKLYRHASNTSRALSSSFGQFHATSNHIIKLALVGCSNTSKSERAQIGFGSPLPVELQELCQHTPAAP